MIRRSVVLMILLALLGFGVTHAEELVKDGFGKARLPNNSVYEGEFKNGLFNGKGTLTGANGDKYAGEFKDGLMEGKGVTITATGDKMEGEFKKGLLNGQGRWALANGAQYEGEFKDGRLNGKGAVVLPGGDRSEGEFTNNEMSGTGTFTYANGTKYLGDFKYGTFNGKGVITFTDGARYEGEFKNGTYNGKGKFKDNDGTQVEGDFVNGLAHGQGVMTKPDGAVYHGEFDKNQANGNGVMTFPNGDRFEGEFKNGTSDGKGMLTYSNGNKYEGEFKNGQPNGKGVEIYAQGNKYEGEFKNGVIPTPGVLILPNGDRYEGKVRFGRFEGTDAKGRKYSGDLQGGISVPPSVLGHQSINGQAGLNEKEKSIIAISAQPNNTSDLIFDAKISAEARKAVTYEEQEKFLLDAEKEYGSNSFALAKALEVIASPRLGKMIPDSRRHIDLLYEKAIKIREERQKSNPSSVNAFYLYNDLCALGDIYVWSKKYDEAESLYDKALEFTKTSGFSDAKGTVPYLIGRKGYSRECQNKLDDSLIFYKEAIKLYNEDITSSMPPDKWTARGLSEVYKGAARVAKRKNMLVEADDFLKKAEEVKAMKTRN